MPEKGLILPPRGDDRKWARSAGVVMNDLAMEKTMNFSFVSCLLRRVVFACVVVGFGQVPSDEEGFAGELQGVKSSARIDLC